VAGGTKVHPELRFGRVKVCRETSRVPFLIWKELTPAAATLRGIKTDRGHPARPACCGHVGDFIEASHIADVDGEA
jgi:hypothetical protein